MQSLSIDRRASPSATGADTDLPPVTRVVRQSVLVQECIGTVGAIEYLKAHEIPGSVIARVLSRECVRQEDRALLGQADR